MRRQGHLPSVKRRAIRTTLLIVGEGYAEVAFLKHLKSLYITRGMSVHIQIFNAYGKGAAHVVGVAIRHSLNASYDRKAALLDTDTDWTEAAKTSAKNAGITVFPSSPCFEATLLKIKKIVARGHTSSSLKKRVLQSLGHSADDTNLYARHFDQATIESARSRIAELDALIKLIIP